MCFSLLQVFYFMQPETTITKLAEDLLKAIHEKFIKIVDEEEEKEGNEESDEKDPLLGDQGLSGLIFFLLIQTSDIEI